MNNQWFVKEYSKLSRDVEKLHKVRDWKSLMEVDRRITILRHKLILRRGKS